MDMEVTAAQYDGAICVHKGSYRVTNFYSLQKVTLLDKRQQAPSLSQWYSFSFIKIKDPKIIISVW